MNLADAWHYGSSITAVHLITTLHTHLPLLALGCCL